MLNDYFDTSFFIENNTIVMLIVLIFMFSMDRNNVLLCPITCVNILFCYKLIDLMVVLSVMLDWKTRLFLNDELYIYSAYNSYPLQADTFRFLPIHSHHASSNKR